jgi:hypothetical protein
MPKNRRPPSKNYRKPPVEFQFKPNQSGNRAGRPPQKKGLVGSALGGGIADRLSVMALEEATRQVTIREGDKVSQLPAMQALLRTMFRAAANGDTKAGKQLVDLITRTEGARVATATETLQYSVQYQERNLALLAKYEREGAEPPEIYPHPDDFVFDWKVGEFQILGPRSREEAGARKVIVAKAIETMGRYLEVKAALEKDPTNRELKREFNELDQYQEVLKADAERNFRHEACRIARQALKIKETDARDEEAELRGQASSGRRT